MNQETQSGQVSELRLKVISDASPVFINAAPRTRGELEDVLEEEDILFNPNSQSIMIKPGNVMLIAEDSLLNYDTTGLCKVFILNKEQKAGAMSRIDINARIRQIIASDPSAKGYFNGGGKNWTNRPSPVLESLIDAYASKNQKPLSKKVVSQVTPVEVEGLQKSAVMNFLKQCNDDAFLHTVNSYLNERFGGSDDNDLAFYKKYNNRV